jgi:hypothetical protein
MALPLPDINGSSGVWGTILNDYLNDMDSRVVAGTNSSTTNTTAITTLTGRVNGHDTAISNNTSAINGLDNRLDAVEGATTPTPPPIASTSDGADQAVSSTAYTAGSPQVGVTFTAPTSGTVLILFGARPQTNTIGVRCHVSVAVRTGSTIGSGTVIAAASDQCSVETGQPTVAGGAGDGSRLQASRHRVITGLSPGSTYNARTEHKVSVAGSGNVFFRNIDVIPL